MSRLLSIFAGISGLFMASVLAAQAPPAQTPPAQTPPAQAAARRVAPPAPALEADNVWNLDLSTGGRVAIQLRPDVAPNHVERIKTLTRQGFYNGLAFFRVIEGFMAQSGDPQNVGMGGSPLPNLAAEINGRANTRSGRAPLGTEPLSEARLGLQVKAAGMRFDVGGIAGLTEFSPRSGITFGVTYDTPTVFAPVK